MRARTVGRYELLEELGRGGTATVYLARQTDLGRLVALKELTALPVSDPSTARRFLRESRLAASLNHPNIVTVHDFFEHRGTPYIAMEYVEGGTLRPVMHELAFPQAAKVLEGLLSGLRFAHERGIVHRDLKPENLMVTGDDRVKIADFGIAKVTDETHVTTALTVKGTTIGTPTYMAPEQALGLEIGPWTDLYAVGVIAFELLAGRPPFETTGAPMAILLRHVNEAPPELAEVNPSVDPRLSDWVAQLLVKDRERRAQSAASVWLAFEEIVLDRLGPRWRRTATLPVAAAAATPATVPLAREDERALSTVMPRSAPPRPAVPTRRRAATTRRRPSRAVAVGRAVRGLLLVGALVAALLAVLAGGNGSGAPEDSSRAAPTAPAVSPAAARPAAARPASREEAPPATSSGVGDSQSDDPSDDEPDGEEP
jgi:predicted Ser/Thr protein kinase